MRRRRGNCRTTWLTLPRILLSGCHGATSAEDQTLVGMRRQGAGKESDPEERELACLWSPMENGGVGAAETSVLRPSVIRATLRRKGDVVPRID